MDLACNAITWDLRVDVTIEPPHYVHRQSIPIASSQFRTTSALSIVSKIKYNAVIAF